MQDARSTRKILIPAFDFKPALGGVAHYTHEIARHLHAQGAEVRVLARALEGAADYDAQSPFPITRAPTSATATLALPAWARAIAREIEHFQPDVLLCPLWFPDAAALELVRLAKKNKLPYAVVVHGMEVLPAPNSAKLLLRAAILAPFKPLVFSHCKKIFAVSHYSRDLTLRTTHASKEKTLVVNNGVNLDTYKKTAPSENLRRDLQAPGKILLTVTRLMPYKGVDQVITALPQILKRHADLKYVVVGVGPDRARLEDLAETLHVENHVIFLGAVEQSKIIELYNTADLFVMLSREETGDVEGFGLVFLEASACGLPSVGGRSGGIPDAIDDGKSGWLVDPRSPTAIAAKIAGLLADNDQLAQASAYGLEMVRSRTWDAAARQVMGGLFG